MKYVKMLGLAAVAAAALMAFVGAGTASATVLCATEPVANGAGTEHATCPEGWAYGAGTVIHAVLDPEQHATLTDGEGNKIITCKKSTVKGKTTNEGTATETPDGPIEVLTFEECTSPFLGNTACTVKTLKGGELEVHWDIDTVNGTLTSRNAEVTTNCNSIFGTIHCIFTTVNTDVGTLTGGNPATLDAESNKISQVATNALCPGEARWDAKYEVTEPKPLYVANET